MTIQYYAYIWYDPQTNTPVYVGKGSGDRAQDHFKSKYRIGKLLRKRRDEGFNLVPKIIIAADEDDAFELEIFLISLIGRIDTGCGPLFNGTDGGRRGKRADSNIRKKSKDICFEKR